jgi:MFS family permease
MSAAHSPRASARAVAAMAFLVMLGGGIQIPAVRPLFGERLHFSESVMHAFMSVNMLGGMLGAPLAAAWADRRGAHRAVCVALAALDAALLGACTLPLAAGPILALRAMQGAANVGVLSIVLGSLGRDRAGEGGHSRTVGLAGSGVMLAVALGPAAGGALLKLGPYAPLRAAAALALLVAAIATASPDALGGRGPDVTPRRSALGGPSLGALLKTPLFVVPAVLAFVERFTVGCFVVTFSLYAHSVRHLSDAQTGIHYSLFLLPFALATYPLTRGTERWSRAAMMALGGVLYGATFVTFGLASGGALALSLMVAGLASAMVYGPSLCCIAAASGQSGRATSMAFFHAAGCLGMLLGPAAAGIASAAMKHAGVDAHARYATVFALAGVAQLAAMLVLRAPIGRLRASEQTTVRDAVQPIPTPNFQP